MVPTTETLSIMVRHVDKGSCRMHGHRHGIATDRHRRDFRISTSPLTVYPCAS